MIKLENVGLASPEQMGFIIEGMRNPMNSWEKSDSDICSMESGIECSYCSDYASCDKTGDDKYHLGLNDHSLMQRLSNAGTEHLKYMRMMPVYVRITAPLYWWKEFDTYKVGVVANSCSTMHKIAEKEFTLEDFSCDHLTEFIPGQKLKGWTLEDNDLIVLDDESDHGYSSVDILNITIKALNFNRKKYLETKDKKYWWQMIQLLPSNYNQTRNVMLNYEVLANIYRQRKNHKLDEWREVCKWIESLPYSELIIGKEEQANGRQ